MRVKRTKSDRQSQILAELNRSPSLRVADLAGHLEVSTETIRRDLDELTEQGLLNRTYGGAVRPLSSEPSVAERHSHFIAQRERIAKATIPLIKSGHVLMIGSGATTVHVARRIAVDLTNITVITHSFGVATVLSLNPTIDILMLPGNYQSGEGSNIGVHTVSFLNTFYADFAILGASGLTPDGPADALIESGAVYTAMVARSSQTLVVADHSKFDRVFPACYASWRKIHHLVTDRTPEGGLMKSLKACGVDIVVA
jgi:DeoR/GlpR family transcriptional regulator of sugar metabolism